MSWETIDIVWPILLVITCLVSWALNLLNLPGNWLIVACAAVYAYFGPSREPLDVGWGVVLVIVVLAVVGEVLEFLAGAVGTARVGGSKRGAVLALVGSIAGGIVGLFIGVPIPVMGPLISALLFGGAGALAGAVVGERWKGRDLNESLRVGGAAFWSRLIGTAGKVAVGGVMVVLALAAVLV